MKRLAPPLFLIIVVLIAAACGDGGAVEESEDVGPTASPVPAGPTDAVAEKLEPTLEPTNTVVTITAPAPAQLTADPATPTSTPEPEESQVSGRIAFVSNQNGADAIFVMDVNDPAGARS